MTSIQLLVAKIIAFVLFCLILVCTGWHYGAKHVQTDWDAQILTDAQAANVHALHVDLVTGEVITQYIDRYQVVLTQGATITKEITRYVTPEVDRHYPVPWGFVRVLNAATVGALPDAIATGGTDEGAATVALSDVASNIADNYTSCRATAEQLRSLQQWITQQQTVDVKKGP